MILLIDNYDSFVHNLARYLAELGCETRVVRNDAVTVEDVGRMSPQAIVLSPGPRTPSAAGISLELVRVLGPTVPMLGVCLGFQTMAAALGAAVVRAAEPVHGQASLVFHTSAGVLAGLSNPLRVGRYHSLVVDEATLPADLQITARTPEGVPMALAHVSWPLHAVQFHPESVLTDGGHRLLSNFLRLAGIETGPCPSGDRVAAEPLLDWSAVRSPGGQPLHW